MNSLNIFLYSRCVYCLYFFCGFPVPVLVHHPTGMWRNGSQDIGTVKRDGRTLTLLSPWYSGGLDETGLVSGGSGLCKHLLTCRPLLWGTCVRCTAVMNRQASWRRAGIAHTCAPRVWQDTPLLTLYTPVRDSRGQESLHLLQLRVQKHGHKAAVSLSNELKL